jgi:hypothetical protein
MTIIYLRDYRCHPRVKKATLAQDLVRLHSLTEMAHAGTAEIAGAFRVCARMFAEMQGNLRQVALHHDRCMTACDLGDLDEMIRARDGIREEMRGVGERGGTT